MFPAQYGFFWGEGWEAFPLGEWDVGYLWVGVKSSLSSKIMKTYLYSGYYSLLWAVRAVLAVNLCTLREVCGGL